MEEESENIQSKGRIRKDDLGTIAEIFRELDKRHQLTPRRLLELAADPESVLHKYFTWDDVAAAEKYRIQQARWLLESITVNLTLPEGKTVTVNYALSVRGNEEKPEARRYVLTGRAAKDKYLLSQVVQQAERELRGIVKKYQSFLALRPILDKLSGVADELKPAQFNA